MHDRLAVGRSALRVLGRAQQMAEGTLEILSFHEAPGQLAGVLGRIAVSGFEPRSDPPVELRATASGHSARAPPAGTARG